MIADALLFANYWYNFTTLWKEEQMFLSESAKVQLPKFGQNLCVLYSQLSAETARQQKKLWKFSPKHHLFQHLCEWQALTHGNPAHYWTYIPTWRGI